MTSKLPRTVFNSLVVVAGILVALFALGDAAARVRGPVAPAVVQSLPADGRLIGKRFDYALRAGGGTALPSDVCWPCQAREVIARDPLDPAPMRILGLYAEREEGVAAARKLMLLAQQISRRDATTQGWLFKDAAGRGDLAMLLRHYDRLLSVRDELYPALFPPLAKGMAAPQIQDGVANFIRQNRPWVFNFMIESGPMVSDPRHLMAMYERVDRGREPLATTLQGQRLLVGQLAKAGYYAEGLAQARRIAGKDRAEIDRFGFPDAEASEEYLPFTWTRGDDQAVGTKFEGKDGVLVENGARSEALALYRVRVLGPGRYELSGAADRIDGYDPLSGVWEVYCVSGQAERRLARLPLTPNNTSSAVSFQVAPDCDATRFQFKIGANASNNLALLRLNSPRLRSLK